MPPGLAGSSPWPGWCGAIWEEERCDGRETQVLTTVWIGGIEVVSLLDGVEDLDDPDILDPAHGGRGCWPKRTVQAWASVAVSCTVSPSSVTTALVHKPLQIARQQS
jgi:hypothetical protein